LDVFSPVKTVMEALQAFALPPWKAALFIQVLIDYLESMSFITGVNVPMWSANCSKIRKEKAYKGKNINILCEFFKMKCIINYSSETLFSNTFFTSATLSW